VTKHVKHWTAARLLLGVVTSGDDLARLTKYAPPDLGAMPLTEVRPRHIRQLVLKLRSADEPLAPRTIRHICGALHTAFRTAVADELIAANPAHSVAGRCHQG
jgi:hypothetical protein